MRNDSVFLKRADEDVSAYYTSALSLSGQSYEWGSSHDDDHDRGLVDCRYRRELAKIERVRLVLWDLDVTSAKSLRDVYTPWGTADFRAEALRANWGSGTLARLANTCPLAVEACARRTMSVASCGLHNVDTSPDAVSRYLRDKAGLGDASTKFFTELRAACEVVRSAALAAYRSVAVSRKVAA